MFDGNKFFYCVGARTAIGIELCAPALAGEGFVQQRVGLHHLCLRARSRDDVERCAALLKEMSAKIVRGPMEGIWTALVHSTADPAKSRDPLVHVSVVDGRPKPLYSG